MEYKTNCQFKIVVMKMVINNFILINPKEFKICHYKIINRYYKNFNTKDKMQKLELDFKITPLVL